MKYIISFIIMIIGAGVGMFLEKQLASPSIIWFCGAITGIIAQLFLNS